MAAPPSSLKDFEIQGRLGSGSYGTVFKVLRLEDKRFYVMKQINITGLNEREQDEAINECRIMARLSHENVVRYYDSFMDEGKLCIVMEYCDRGDLQMMLKKQQKAGVNLPEDRVWSLFFQMCLGLYYLHKNRILHRDMKTANVFLTSNDGLKIGDLGVARVLGTNTNFARTCVGTPYYLSPELCEDRPYDHKSDVWALGCIVYECCCGRKPFEALNQASLILKIVQGKVKRLDEKYGSRRLVNLVAKMLTKNPAKRPSVKQLLTSVGVMEKAKELGYSLPPELAELAADRERDRAAGAQFKQARSGKAVPQSTLTFNTTGSSTGSRPSTGSRGFTRSRNMGGGGRVSQAGNIRSRRARPGVPPRNPKTQQLAVGGQHIHSNSSDAAGAGGDKLSDVRDAVGHHIAASPITHTDDSGDSMEDAVVHRKSSSKQSAAAAKAVAALPDFEVGSGDGLRRGRSEQALRTSGRLPTGKLRPKVRPSAHQLDQLTQENKARRGVTDGPTLEARGVGVHGRSVSAETSSAYEAAMDAEARAHVPGMGAGRARPTGTGARGVSDVTVTSVDMVSAAGHESGDDAPEYGGYETGFRHTAHGVSGELVTQTLQDDADDDVQWSVADGGDDRASKAPKAWGTVPADEAGGWDDDEDDLGEIDLDADAEYEEDAAAPRDRRAPALESVAEGGGDSTIVRAQRMLDSMRKGVPNTVPDEADRKSGQALYYGAPQELAALLDQVNQERSHYDNLYRQVADSFDSTQMEALDKLLAGTRSGEEPDDLAPLLQMFGGENLVTAVQLIHKVTLMADLESRIDRELRGSA